MAQSKCIKCDSTQFELVQHSPSKSTFKLVFTQCAKCGGVVGVTEFYNIGDKLEKLFKALNIPFN